ncbi:MAG TPA: hypothetical protein VEU33_34070 [Archangium sp.]|nr:hypothetical protein [Archangium sp.]
MKIPPAAPVLQAYTGPMQPDVRVDALLGLERRGAAWVAWVRMAGGGA